MVRIAVLVSGGGTNLQALIDAQGRGEIPERPDLPPSSPRVEDAYRPGTGKAGRAFPAMIINRKEFGRPTRPMTDGAGLSSSRSWTLAWWCWQGLCTILRRELYRRPIPKPIMNVHPALIPSFCGKGFYGLHVHEAALAYGVKVTGATVHFVSEDCDGGPIVLQKAVAI